MKPAFEAHITYNREFTPQLKEALTDQLREVGWQFSAFDADPIMGDKPYAYLTAYDTDPEKLLYRMVGAVATLYSLYYISPLRQKIEEIIYDTKTGRDWRSGVGPGKGEPTP